jgi:hypothetical protein
MTDGHTGSRIARNARLCRCNQRNLRPHSRTKRQILQFLDTFLDRERLKQRVSSTS